jgi:hypothetical protein
MSAAVVVERLLRLMQSGPQQILPVFGLYPNAQIEGTDIPDLYMQASQ